MFKKIFKKTPKLDDLVTGADGFGLKILEIFGLQNKRVTKLEILIEPNSIVTVNATLYLEKQEGIELIKILANYKSISNG